MSATYYNNEVHRDRIVAISLINSLTNSLHILSDDDVTRIRLEISFTIARLCMNRRSALAIEHMNPTRVYKPIRKYKRISTTDYDAESTEPCAVCMEKRKKGDTITTECNHSFCKPCWNKWMDTNNRTCPCCRNACKSVTVYSIKK
jgi:hypothetical protein